MAREWGFWTRGKLQILRNYLNEFTTTAKHKATERLYFDLFAMIRHSLVFASLNSTIPRNSRNSSEPTFRTETFVCIQETATRPSIKFSTT